MKGRWETAAVKRAPEGRAVRSSPKKVWKLAASEGEVLEFPAALEFGSEREKDGSGKDELERFINLRRIPERLSKT